MSELSAIKNGYNWQVASVKETIKPNLNAVKSWAERQGYTEGFRSNKIIAKYFSENKWFFNKEDYTTTLAFKIYNFKNIDMNLSFTVQAPQQVIVDEVNELKYPSDTIGYFMPSYHFYDNTVLANLGHENINIFETIDDIKRVLKILNWVPGDTND